MKCKQCGISATFRPDTGWSHIGPSDHDVVFQDAVAPVTDAVLDVPYDGDAEGSLDQADLTEIEKQLLIYGAKPQGIPWYRILRHERRELCHCPSCHCDICAVFGAE